MHCYNYEFGKASPKKLGGIEVTHANCYLKFYFSLPSQPFLVATLNFTTFYPPFLFKERPHLLRS